MGVIQAHKLLISIAIALFCYCTVLELRHYSAGDSSALLRAGVAALITGGLGLYLRSVYRRYAGPR